MTQLIMLGTGNAMAIECYNTCFALKSGKEYFLVDAGGGNGIFTQLKKANIACTDIHHMFITHAHTDHLLGMVWMVRNIAMMINNGKYEGTLTIYCHDEVKETLLTICRLTLPQKIMLPIGNRILIQEVKDGDKAEIANIKLSFFDIASTKMKQFGFQAILPNQKTLVCLGDEPYNEKSHRYVAHCDWLLCEAFCLYADKERFKPYEKHHSTALDAGRLAEELNVKNLLLYHTEDENIKERKYKYSREASRLFKGNIFVPDDLEIITL